eukprot:GHRQ01033630.1.p2 GENE.GHRQ01033630.1~~GHRQ01033630.1.p2  ORF type:complete len:128 (+),score=32.08 GHRQ01033630.1:339-722(+)
MSMPPQLVPAWRHHVLTTAVTRVALAKLCFIRGHPCLPGVAHGRLQGIGRTGTFCAVDILLQRLDAWPSCRAGAGPDRGEVESALNLPVLVHELRQQRMGMVQTQEQVKGLLRVWRVTLFWHVHVAL